MAQMKKQTKQHMEKTSSKQIIKHDSFVTATRVRAESSGIRFASNDLARDASAWALAKHAKVFKKLAE
jgi:hypothetical protein